jgi:beta-lactamase class A
MAKKKKIIFILISIIAISSLLYHTYKTNADFIENKKNNFAAKKEKAAWRFLEKDIKREAGAFNGDVAVVIKDLATSRKILFGQNKLFPSASLVKIPVMAACFYAADTGKINLTQRVCLRREDKVSGSGLLKNEAAEREFTVRELLGLMITESDNTASNMLIKLLGFDYLNNCFKKFGLKNTNISRRMMDFSNRRDGIENYTSAGDIAYLLEKIYRQQLINRTVSRDCLTLLKLQKMRDRIPARLPADTIIAHKTGLERGICHDAGIVFTDNGDFLICVLTKYKSKTAKKAKKFIARIAFLAYNYYENY